MSGNPPASGARRPWPRFLLTAVVVAALVIALDASGLKDRLYRIPYVLDGLRLFIALVFAGLAVLLLVAKDEAAPRGLAKWLMVAFALTMAAVQAATVAGLIHDPSKAFQE